MRRYKIANLRCLLVKYSKDNRYDAQNVTTHDRSTMNAVQATELCQIRAEAKDHEVVGVDEGQFVSDDDSIGTLIVEWVTSRI